ncbi:MAG: metallophosphoesterase family protein, partial [Nitrososphaeraceae archaeon]
MKTAFDRKIKILNLILLIITITIFGILFLLGCNNRLNNVKENSNVRKTSQNIIETTKQTTETTREKIDKEITGNTASTIKEAAEKNNKETELDSNNSIDATSNEVLFSFSVCGDNRPADDFLPQPKIFLTLLELIKKEDIAFHITTGDIINGGTDNSKIIERQFSDYLDALKILPVINFVSAGNHDSANDTSKKYFLEMINKKAFRESLMNGVQIFIPDIDNGTININTKLKDESSINSFYYYFEFKGTYFIVLDAFEKGYWGAVESSQLTWLEKVLESLRDKEVFVFIHVPVYSVLNPETIINSSKHVAFSNKKNEDYIRELFKEYKVDCVFSGHEHLYNKQFHDGTTYIITALSGEYP